MALKYTREAKRQAAYKNSLGDECPFCKDMYLEWGEVDSSQFGFVTEPVQCNKCGSSWTNTYTLSGFSSEKVSEKARKLMEQREKSA